MCFYDSQYSSQYLTLYILNRENPHNSEPQNGPRRGLDFIALRLIQGASDFEFTYAFKFIFLNVKTV